MKITDNPILNSLTDNGIPYTVTEEGTQVPGFYKSDICLLKISDNGKMYALTRYGQIDEIKSFVDLVILNFQWWKKSRARSDAWSVPNPYWEKYVKNYK